MKTYIITGATRGLGLSIAEYLYNEPETKVVIAVRNLKKGKEVAKSLGEGPGS